MMGHKFTRIYCVYDMITTYLYISILEVSGAVPSSEIEIEKKTGVRIQVATIVMVTEYCFTSSLKTETSTGSF